MVAATLGQAALDALLRRRNRAVPSTNQDPAEPRPNQPSYLCSRDSGSRGSGAGGRDGGGGGVCRPGRGGVPPERDSVPGSSSRGIALLDLFVRLGFTGVIHLVVCRNANASNSVGHMVQFAHKGQGPAPHLLIARFPSLDFAPERSKLCLHLDAVSPNGVEGGCLVRVPYQIDLGANPYGEVTWSWSLSRARNTHGK